MILACQNIEKSFDGELLLQDVNFHIEEREKAPFSVVVLGNFRRFFFLFFRFFFRPSIFPLFTTNF